MKEFLDMDCENYVNYGIFFFQKILFAGPGV